ncbi:amino acid transporter [Myriangium duriaei CBS 260.36]|uniref:Amino acid transporter n=1 Tax=Myriangium duriaei CBS 260.36 TaxID=1168546 RepID=A0A9P4MPJ7_9PEZI|nr:amino acid transporter [Myriangium duriaei CBS 260.36]
MTAVDANIGVAAAHQANNEKQTLAYAADSDHVHSARKQSIVGAIKDNYIVQGPDDDSIKQSDSTHRNLRPRHIQLIGIGGTIGTALFVNIGKGVLNGGPGSLFTAFTIWCMVILCVTNCMAEMVTYLPISSPFIRFAGRWVDEAFGVAAGYNFFVFEAALVPFEIVACSVIIKFWTDVIPVAAIITIVIVIYALINLFAVKWYGESEFWLALGKVLLIVGLLFYTFIVMVGGNPLHDKFGFRYWREPGAFKALDGYEGSRGVFLGWLSCLIQASFTIAGPDYVSMAAGEAENPRVVLPRAYKAVFYRLTSFFMLGSLAVGILVPYDDKDLHEAYSSGAPGAAASPYVNSMVRLHIPVLPHIVNALVLTSALSAGNSYVYCASRSLYGLALEGKAPKIFRRCTRTGVPIYCVAVVLLIALLAFLQVSSEASVVLNWFVSLVTASQLINFSVMCLTYIMFHRALKVQGIDRATLPYRAWCQPCLAYVAGILTIVMAFVGGYAVFLPGAWDVPTFLFSYTMIFVFPLIYFGWKLLKRTKRVKSNEANLHENLTEITEYEANYIPRPPRNMADKWFNKVFS